MNGRSPARGRRALVLLAALIVATTYWQAWAAAGLADRQDNAIQRVAQFTVDRGKIYAADGTPSRGQPGAEGRRSDVLLPPVPERRARAHVVGYSTQARSRTGLEQSLNDYLAGANTNLAASRARARQAQGRDGQGQRHLPDTGRRGAQRVAINALGGQLRRRRRAGGADRAVLVLASNRPTTRTSSSSTSRKLAQRRRGVRLRAAPRPRDAGPLLRRARPSRSSPPPPRSTRGKFTPDSASTTRATARSTASTSRTRATRAGPRRSERHLRARRSSTRSTPSSATSARRSAPEDPRLREAVRLLLAPRRSTRRSTSDARAGCTTTGKLFDPKHPTTRSTPAGSRSGRSRLLVTPLQMAMVAATVAQRRRRDAAAPRREGRRAGRHEVVTDEAARARPRDLARRRSRADPDDAAVVTGGTGTAAQIPGVHVAGKTGTAETGIRSNTTWFICFAPADNPKVAVAVALENQPASAARRRADREGRACEASCSGSRTP